MYSHVNSYQKVHLFIFACLNLITLHAGLVRQLISSEALIQWVQSHWKINKNTFLLTVSNKGLSWPSVHGLKRLAVLSSLCNFPYPLKPKQQMAAEIALRQQAYIVALNSDCKTKWGRKGVCLSCICRDWRFWSHFSKRQVSFLPPCKNTELCGQP